MLINEAIKKLPQLELSSEFVTLKDAVNRILFEDIFAIKNLPSFDNSALDGYAINYATKDMPLSVVDTIFAGDMRNKILQNGTCVKIMTGAKIPKNSDTIVPFEDAIIENEKLIVSSKIKQFNAYRYKGEEVKVGEILLKSGTKLNSADVMLLASQGIFCVKVQKSIKIGIFSSGNELVEPWNNASEEQIYNANAAGLMALLLSFGFNSSYKGVIKDSLQMTISAINSDDSDILICSGGASAGEADYMKTALISLGFDEIFGFLNIRPGRPTKAYSNGKKIIFVLPGNPMAAFIMAFLIIVPFLKNEAHTKIKATLNESVKVKSGRQNLVLGQFENGNFSLVNGNNYGSGMITPLVKSNAIYITNIDESEICNGSEIFVYKIS
jgi:molybdenum cofactor synthesis domain protein